MWRMPRGLGLPSFSIVLALLGSCRSTPKAPDPTPGSSLGAIEALQTPREPIEQVLLRLKAAQESWYTYKLDLPRQEARNKLERVERYLRDTSSRYLPEILEKLVTGGEFQRAIAAFAAGWPRDPQAIQPLINALRDSSSAVVGQACAGLFILSLPAVPAGPLLEVAESHPDPESRNNAVLALSALARQPGRHDLKPYLLDFLDSQDARVRVHSLRGLLPLVDAEDRLRLLPLLQDPSSLVRRAAVMAVGRLRHPQVVEALIQSVSAREKDDNVRLFARKGLQRLSGGEDAGYDERAWRRIFGPMLEAETASEEP